MRPRCIRSGNVLRSVPILRGDPQASGEVVIRGRYEVGIQDQAFLGPESGLAIPDGDGGVELHIATQWLHVDRDQIAAGLGLPTDRVQVVLAGVGGAFGAREDLSMQLHACMLALHCGRPVKMAYLREESFTGGHVHRHPAWMEYEHHADRQGKLLAVRARIWLDGGAYASTSPAVVANATTLAVGPYAVANADLLGHRRLHQQPAQRRDARLRRGAGCDRLRGADGSAGSSGRARSAGGARLQRAVRGRRLADRPGGPRAGGDGGAARCAGGAAASRSRSSMPATCPAARSARHAARASGAASATRRASRTSPSRRAFDDPSTACVRLTVRDGRAARRGPHGGRRGRPGRARRAGADRAHRAGRRGRRRPGGRYGDRLGWFGFGLAADLDDRWCGQARVRRGAQRGAGAGGGSARRA